MWQYINRLVKILGDIGIAIAATATVLTVLMVTGGTILRYAFNSPLYFIEEYTGYVMVLITFLGLAYTLRVGGHVAIDVIPNYLPEKYRVWLDVVTTFISLVMVSILFKFGWALFNWSLYSDLRANTVLMTPLWIPQILVPVGLFVFGLELLAQLVSKVRRCLQS